MIHKMSFKYYIEMSSKNLEQLKSEN